ncbi:MAG: XRE family transcriptional regulator [Betaproteobacteria bacterium]|nr:MAG: XRE family transcriptional regulator [Betaproteobacteria bacterium]
MRRMPVRSRFVEALKKALRARGFTYAQLARRLDVSEPTVKRMFSRGSFTLARIEQILRLLDLELYDVARMARGRPEGPAELTPEQESVLARDERLLSVFWLLLNDWSFEEILLEFAIARAELTLAFARLARARLIEWGPRERARLAVPRDFQWRAGGPVKKAYGTRVMREFLDSRFDGAAELLRFEARELSADSAAVLRRRLERVVAEFNETAEVDAPLPGRRRQSFGLLVACRPWEFSVMIALKRRRAGAAQPEGRRSKPA